MDCLADDPEWVEDPARSLHLKEEGLLSQPVEHDRERKGLSENVGDSTRRVINIASHSC